MESSSSKSSLCVVLGCGAVAAFVPALVALILSLVLRTQRLELHSNRRQLIHLTYSLQNLSPIDNFAEHARTKRKISALKTKILSQETSYAGKATAWKYGLKFVFYLITVLSIAYFLRSNGGLSGIILGQDWFSPLDCLLCKTSFETGVVHLRSEVLIALTFGLSRLFAN